MGVVRQLVLALVGREPGGKMDALRTMQILRTPLLDLIPLSFQKQCLQELPNCEPGGRVVHFIFQLLCDSDPVSPFSADTLLPKCQILRLQMDMSGREGAT